MATQAKNFLKKFRKAKTLHPAKVELAKEFLPDKQKELKNKEYDPLIYLDKFPIEVKPGNVEEYIKVEVQEEKKVPPNPMGAYGSFKLNFADILKARQNLGNKSQNKPEQTLKAVIKHSIAKEEVKNDNSSDTESDNENEKQKEEEIEKNEPVELNLPELSEERQKRMLQRLQKAKKKFTYYYEKKNKIKISENIMRKAKELQEKINLPTNLLEKIKNVVESIKLPSKCVMDEDVQIISENEAIVTPIKKEIPKIDLQLFMKKY